MRKVAELSRKLGTIRSSSSDSEQNSFDAGAEDKRPKLSARAQKRLKA